MHASPLHAPVSHEPEFTAPKPPRLTELPPPEAPPVRPVGRPSSYTADKVYAACVFIRLTGASDTAAGVLAGVKRSTLSRWKTRDEEVEMQLERARAEYLMPRLDKIAQTRRRDGQLDWRAQAWLVKFASPGTHGRPSSRRRLRDVEIDDEERAATEAALHAISQAGATRGVGEEAATAFAPRKNVAICPETRGAAGGAAGESETGRPPNEAGDVENVAIRPEIPKPGVSPLVDPETGRASETEGGEGFLLPMGGTPKPRGTGVPPVPNSPGLEDDAENVAFRPETPRPGVSPSVDPETGHASDTEADEGRRVPMGGTPKPRGSGVPPDPDSHRPTNEAENVAFCPETPRRLEPELEPVSAHD